MGRPLTAYPSREGSAVQREKVFGNQVVLGEKSPQAIGQLQGTYLRQGEPHRFVGI